MLRCAKSKEETVTGVVDEYMEGCGRVLERVTANHRKELKHLTGNLDGRGTLFVDTCARAARDVRSLAVQLASADINTPMN